MEITSAEAFFQEQKAEFEAWQPSKTDKSIRYKHLPLPDHDVRNCKACHQAKAKAVDLFNAKLGYEGAPRAHECGPFQDPAAKRVKECWRVEAQRFGVMLHTRCQEWKELLDEHNKMQHEEYLKALAKHYENTCK